MPASGLGSGASVPSVSSGRHSAAIGEHHRLDPVPDSELGEDPCDVCLDRGLGEEELVGDLRVGQSLGHRPEHVELAVGELIDAWRGD